MSDPKIPRSARGWLREELDQWRAEGLVDERAAEEIARRYGLGPGDGARGVLLAVYFVASFLIGGGVLSFVAWNWEALPDPAKLGLGGVSLIAAYAAGFWMWKLDGRRPILGHALVVLGCLLFGGNIGIVSQVYQLDGEWYASLGLWAAGTALAAWTMRSGPSAALACAIALFWTIGYVEDTDALWAPYVPAVVLLPLAFLLRSPVLFGWIVLVTAGVLAGATAEVVNHEEFVPVSLLATAALLFLSPYALERRYPELRSMSTALAVLGTLVVAYFLSFHEVAEEMTMPGLEGVVGAWAWAVVPQAVGVAVCAALAIGGRPESFARRPLGVVGFTAAVVVLLGTCFPEPEVPLAIAANLAICALAGYGITTSVHSLSRRNYWASIGLLLLVVVSRFIEYETGLLVKAGVFTGCGLAVLFLGLAFERRVAQGVSHA